MTANLKAWQVGIGLALLNAALPYAPAQGTSGQPKSGWVFCWTREGAKIPTRYLFTSPIRSELAAKLDDDAVARVIRSKGLMLGLDDAGKTVEWTKGCSQIYATKDEVPAARRAYYDQLKTDWARQGWTMNFYVVLNWPESAAAPAQ